MAVLHIAGGDTIQSVQNRFENLYPYLRLNIFRPRMAREGYTSGPCLPAEKLTSVNRNFKEGNFEFPDNISIAGFEQAFCEKFGLPVQVSRLSGKLWMETSLSDHLSLKEQNELGRDISA